MGQNSLIFRGPMIVNGISTTIFENHVIKWLLIKIFGCFKQNKGVFKALMSNIAL